jgi:hypothetical protein
VTYQVDHRICEYEDSETVSERSEVPPERSS